MPITMFCITFKSCSVALNFKWFIDKVKNKFMTEAEKCLKRGHCCFPSSRPMISTCSCVNSVKKPSIEQNCHRGCSLGKEVIILVTSTCFQAQNAKSRLLM